MPRYLVVKCNNCDELVAENRRDCPACGHDNGFPNVRSAEQAEECSALAKRVDHARVSVSARDVMAELAAFEVAIKDSKAVISRSLSDVLTLAKGEVFSYSSFARQVRAGTRTPADNSFDKIRLQFENALFPNYSEDIMFASLSLNEKGMSGYGGYDIVLKDKMIASRATVFEENPYNFSQKHKLALTDIIPAGYRAAWNKRTELCVAKLHGDIEKNMTVVNFADILQKDNGETGNSDFVEVHIHGTLNQKTIEKVLASAPLSKEDKLLWRVVKRDLTKIGVGTETI